MKKLLLALAIVSLPALADVYVPGYVKKDGTYVQGHYQTSPNGTKLDNYSTQGNTNPYTGQRGTVDPYRVEPPKTYTNPYANPYEPPKPYKPYQPPKY